SFLQSKIEDTTLTYLRYPGNIHAHIFVSWLHPFKEHRLVVIGNKGMIVFEDSISQNKLKYYPKGFTKINQQLTKFEGDFETIDFDNLSPLEEEQKHFFDSIINNQEPLTNGTHALEVLKILEEAQKRLHKFDTQNLAM
ncbi:MAG: Gfo/Idh/MocA family oxidoreductase, partial [Nitrososphaeraceae archaeon]